MIFLKNTTKKQERKVAVDLHHEKKEKATEK